MHKCEEREREKGEKLLSFLNSKAIPLVILNYSFRLFYSHCIHLSQIT